MSKEETALPESEVVARLAAELPHWRYENGWIRRKYKTHSWKGTLMVVNTVGHLAEAAWHHPDLTVSYAFVAVKLMNHAAKGITEKDIEQYTTRSPYRVLRFSGGLAMRGWGRGANYAFNAGLVGQIVSDHAN